MAYFGKDKCEYLRDLRVKIAEANGIDYVPAECHHEGDCPGFCPVCDGEMEFIAKALEEKANRGENIKLSGLQVDDTRLANYASVMSDSDGGIDDIKMGNFEMVDIQVTDEIDVYNVKELDAVVDAEIRRNAWMEKHRIKQVVDISRDSGGCSLEEMNRKHRERMKQNDREKREKRMHDEPLGGLVRLTNKDE